MSKILDSKYEQVLVKDVANPQPHLSLKIFEDFCVSLIGPETSGGFYEYSSLLCLLVTALSLTTTAGSDKLKEFARVGIFSTAITKFI